jgi:hypothetical protein
MTESHGNPTYQEVLAAEAVKPGAIRRARQMRQYKNLFFTQGYCNVFIPEPGRS